MTTETQPTTIPMEQARTKLADLGHRALVNREHITVTRHGRPYFVIAPPDMAPATPDIDRELAEAKAALDLVTASELPYEEWVTSVAAAHDRLAEVYDALALRLQALPGSALYNALITAYAHHRGEAGEYRRKATETGDQS